MAIKYIATTGNDTTGDGSLALPWLTFAKALTGTSAGDTITVGAGTFTWATASVTNRIVIGSTTFSSGLPTTIFDGAAGNIIWTLDGTTAISNIMFQNATRTSFYGFFEGAANNSASSTFTNCVFRNLTLYNGNTQVCVIAKSTGNSCSLTVTNCLFYALTGWIVNTVHALCKMRNGTGGTVTLTGNTVYLPSGQLAATLFEGNSATTSTLTCKNNIIYNATGAAITWGASLTGYTQTLNNNCLVNITSAPTNTNGITSDPLFIDPANGNFNLRPTSPAIDTGLAV
jgi:hypothetical protein